MSIDSTHRYLRRKLKEDISSESKKSEGIKGSGGDFYTPFWRDAKDFVENGGTIEALETFKSQTADRINANKKRANIYNALRDNFLDWWDNKRRWNEPFRMLGRNIKSHKKIDNLDATIKIENLLCLTTENYGDRYIYPYFSGVTTLSPETARLGLWMLTSEFTEIDPRQFRILDVIRGRSFSIEEIPLKGNEEQIFMDKYSAILKQWEDLKKS